MEEAAAKGWGGGAFARRVAKGTSLPGSVLCNNSREGEPLMSETDKVSFQEVLAALTLSEPAFWLVMSVGRHDPNGPMRSKFQIIDDKNGCPIAEAKTLDDCYRRYLERSNRPPIQDVLSSALAKHVIVNGEVITFNEKLAHKEV